MPDKDDIGYISPYRRRQMNKIEEARDHLKGVHVSTTPSRTMNEGRRAAVEIGRIRTRVQNNRRGSK